MELLFKYAGVKQAVYTISRNIRTLCWVCESDAKVFEFFDCLDIQYLLNINTTENFFQKSYKAELWELFKFLAFLK